MKKYLITIAALIVFFIVILLASRLLGYHILKYAPEAMSMHPTISPGDLCLCRMNTKYDAEELKREMIVLLKHKNYDHLLTKRIIAKENDLIEIKNNKTYLNNELLDETYISEIMNTDNNIYNIDPLRIGKDNLFVMGDNRKNSLDSRNAAFGLVNIDDIVGRPLIILWSKNKSKIFSSP